MNFLYMNLNLRSKQYAILRENIGSLYRQPNPSVREEKLIRSFFRNFPSFVQKLPFIR